MVTSHVDNNVLLGIGSVILIILAIVWTLFWTGFGLWRAAQGKQRNWFIVILIVSRFFSLLGILEIIYLFKFASKRLTIAEIRGWIKK